MPTFVVQLPKIHSKGPMLDFFDVSPNNYHMQIGDQAYKSYIPLALIQSIKPSTNPIIIQSHNLRLG